MTIIDAHPDTEFPATSSDTRLDVLTEQIAFIAAEMEEQRAFRLQVGELVRALNEISGPAFAMATDRMQQFDERGYVEFARGGAAIADRVVSSFGPDDIEALGDNIVLILQTVREMTQPEVMGMLRRTAISAQHVDTDVADSPSLFALAREMRDPEVRRGLGRTLSVLRTIGSENTTTTKE